MGDKVSIEEKQKMMDQALQSPSFSKMIELMEREEELHPDLQEYLASLGSGMMALCHPLLYCVPYTPTNALHNERYKYKLQELEKAIAEKRWGTVIAIYERPYRFRTLAQYADQMSDKELGENFSWVWMDSENMHQNASYVEKLLSTNRLTKELIMDQEELELFEKLPDKIRVYRGHHGHNKKGVCWTLSYGIAKMFQKRLSTSISNSGVLTGLVDKKDVIALFCGRSELEIVVRASKVKQVVPVKLPKVDNKFWELAKSQFKLSWRSCHSSSHWEKVLINATRLAEQVPGADLKVCQMFAVFHDCKRQNENHDPEHGLRSAKYVSELVESGDMKLSKEQLNKLAYACEYHEKGMVSDDPTIGVCWDADRLDLPRVGIVVDPQYLSTEVAKQTLWTE